MTEIHIESPKHGNHTIHIDDEDFPKISKYKWHINYHNKNVYATTVFRVKENGKSKSLTYKMHRLILGFPDKHIDHKDGNGLNNCNNNLRIATPNQNTKNKSISSNNSSGFKGVCFSNKTKAFQAQIKVNGKMIWGGYHANAIEAAIKYNEMALEYHGEFAKLNIIPQ